MLQIKMVFYRVMQVAIVMFSYAVMEPIISRTKGLVYQLKMIKIPPDVNKFVITGIT